MRKKVRTTNRMKPPVGMRAIPGARYRVIWFSRSIGKNEMIKEEMAKHTIVGKMVTIRKKECVIDDIKAHQPKEGLY